MISYLILLGAVVASLGGNLFSAACNRREKDGSAILLYNLIYTATAFFGWRVIWLTQMSFDAGVLWYSLGFGVGFVMAQGGYIRALQLGPISLSALLLQFSLIITAVWGLVFLGRGADCFDRCRSLLGYRFSRALRFAKGRSRRIAEMALFRHRFDGWKRGLHYFAKGAGVKL